MAGWKTNKPFTQTTRVPQRFGLSNLNYLRSKTFGADRHINANKASTFSGPRQHAQIAAEV